MELIKRIHRRLTSEKLKIFHKVQESHDIKAAAKQFSSILKLSDPFFMIGIPGSVHIMMLTARYLPPEINLVLVLNGMEPWEEEKAKELIKPREVIKLGSNRVIAHGKVLDMLFANYPKPFGILDYDCFVFNPACFRTMQSLDDHSLLNALFFQESPMLGRTPQTFFLFFNTPVINTLREKYKVESGITDFQKRISPKAVRQLKKIGVDKDHYPENNKKYFDTLRLLVSLGYSEGYKCNYLDKCSSSPTQSADAFHVGGVANPNSTYGWWAVRGSYFWWRALEACRDEELRLHYYHNFGNRSSSDVFIGFLEYQEKTGQEFFDTIEALLS